MPASPLKICFVAHFAYKALAAGQNGHVGGVERQVAMMARWLSANGHQVSVVVSEKSDEIETEIDGILIIPTRESSAGLPGIRFFYPRWSSLLAALSRADADIYYHNCAEYVTGQIAIWARLRNRTFVYSVASDPECLAPSPVLRTMRERLLYGVGIKLADGVIVQTRLQQTTLKRERRLESTVLPMPANAAPTTISRQKRSGDDRLQVLWIGRIAPVKQLEVLLEVAAICPSIDFHVVGGADKDPDYAKKVLERAESMSNVFVHGVLGYDDVDRAYARYDVLCCTSEYEGFPNTFLEAWRWGRPVVSTIDPDGLLEAKKLGIFCKDAAAIADTLQRLEFDDGLLADFRSRTTKYFGETHEIDTSMPRFEAFLTKAKHMRDRSRRKEIS